MAAECAEHCVNVFNCVVNVHAEPQPVVAVRDDNLLLCEFPLAGNRFFSDEEMALEGIESVERQLSEEFERFERLGEYGDLGPRWGLTFSGDDVQSWPYCDI